MDVSNSIRIAQIFLPEASFKICGTFGKYKVWNGVNHSYQNLTIG
jgi:hypothetical protein